MFGDGHTLYECEAKLRMLAFQQAVKNRANRYGADLNLEIYDIGKYHRMYDSLRVSHRLMREYRQLRDHVGDKE